MGVVKGETITLCQPETNVGILMIARLKSYVADSDGNCGVYYNHIHALWDLII